MKRIFICITNYMTGTQYLFNQFILYNFIFIIIAIVLEINFQWQLFYSIIV